MMAKSKTIKCSFCGKGRNKVRAIMGGPNDVYLCCECADLAVEVMAPQTSDARKRRRKTGKAAP